MVLQHDSERGGEDRHDDRDKQDADSALRSNAPPRNCWAVDDRQDWSVVDLLDASRLILATQSKIELLPDRDLSVQLLLLEPKLGGGLPLAISLIEGTQCLFGSTKVLVGGRDAALDELTSFASGGLASMQIEVGETVEEKLKHIAGRDRLRRFDSDPNDVRSLIHRQRDPGAEHLQAIVKAP